VEVSAAGLKLEVEKRISPGTRVTFRIDGIQLHGSGSVRYCIRHKLDYRVGVEFSGGLRYGETGGSKV